MLQCPVCKYHQGKHRFLTSQFLVSDLLRAGMMGHGSDRCKRTAGSSRMQPFAHDGRHPLTRYVNQAGILHASPERQSVVKRGIMPTRRCPQQTLLSRLAAGKARIPTLEHDATSSRGRRVCSRRLAYHDRMRACPIPARAYSRPQERQTACDTGRRLSPRWTHI